MNFIFKGFLIGFSIAAPVGPIGVLCIRRSVAHGRVSGLVTGLGAATADAVYGCVAGFGLTVISNFLVGQKFWLEFLGGLFLCYLGVRTFVSRPNEQLGEAPSGGLFSAFLSTFFLTITNPMTILSFVAIFAGLGLGKSADYFNASALVAGVFAGSALWWLLLSGGAALFRSKITLGWMHLLNRVSGTIILAFGIYSLFTALVKG
ncbi:MAG TPA: LysE family transporter [Chthoniobacterales bacterium]|nr:LysE family transporter [Chthoniobacterales bacterium]